jgi:hypothetical protein
MADFDVDSTRPIMQYKPYNQKNQISPLSYFNALEEVFFFSKQITLPYSIQIQNQLELKYNTLQY